MSTFFQSRDALLRAIDAQINEVTREHRTLAEAAQAPLKDKAFYAAFKQGQEFLEMATKHADLVPEELRALFMAAMNDATAAVGTARMAEEETKAIYGKADEVAKPLVELKRLVMGDGATHRSEPLPVREGASRDNTAPMADFSAKPRQPRNDRPSRPSKSHGEKPLDQKALNALRILNAPDIATQ